MNGGSQSDAPLTGHAFPTDDAKVAARTAAALATFTKISIPYGPQKAVATRIGVLHNRCLGQRGMPLPGLRFSQVSQAGKSFVLEGYRNNVMSRMLAATGMSNPYQVLYLGLEVRITVRMLCCELLRKLGDPHCQQGNTDEIKLRMKEFMEYRGTELLIIDEAQHLNRESEKNVDVTDELKRLMDAGIVPIVFAGDQTSRAFFERNPQLASRLGTPLELSPVAKKEVSQLSAFKNFCSDLDTAMAQMGCTRTRSGLAEKAQLEGLLAASGGHIGRVFRIVEAALEHSSLRDADHVELYDLAFAVDTFAMPQGYARHNTFRATKAGGY